jgi:hypothetical protein
MHTSSLEETQEESYNFRQNGSLSLSIHKKRPPKGKPLLDFAKNKQLSPICPVNLCEAKISLGGII